MYSYWVIPFRICITMCDTDSYWNVHNSIPFPPPNKERSSAECEGPGTINCNSAPRARMWNNKCDRKNTKTLRDDKRWTITRKHRCCNNYWTFWWELRVIYTTKMPYHNMFVIVIASQACLSFRCNNGNLSNFNSCEPNNISNTFVSLSYTLH
jgi:hypothetical protein